MGKAETVEKYIDQYLQDKKPEAAEKFRQKDINKQYATIMGWRRKLRQLEVTPKSADEILSRLKQLQELIYNLSEISTEDSKRIELQITALRSVFEECMERQKLRTIQELERQQQEIARRLQELKGEEPNLFNI